MRTAAGSYVDGGRYYTYALRAITTHRGITRTAWPYYFYRPTYLTAFSFGFGPYGRGYFYFDSFYDSYVFYPRTIVRYGDYGSYGYPTGQLQARRSNPRDAQVYIDGSYAGLVDDFDGVFQSLRLEAGEYHVEIVLPGFEPLAFDVRILPGEKTTYRGDLRTAEAVSQMGLGVIGLWVTTETDSPTTISATSPLTVVRLVKKQIQRNPRQNDQRAQPGRRAVAE